MITFKQYLLESPDGLISKNNKLLVWNNIKSLPVTFIIIDNVIYYIIKDVKKHSELINIIRDGIKYKSFKNVLKHFKQHDIETINFDISKYKPDLINDVINNELDYYRLLIRGRFWMVDDGYISFWSDLKIIKPKMPIIENFIKKLGYDAKSVLWESMIEHNIGSVTYNDERLVTYKDYITGNKYAKTVRYTKKTIDMDNKFEKPLPME